MNEPKIKKDIRRWLWVLESEYATPDSVRLATEKLKEIFRISHGVVPCIVKGYRYSAVRCFFCWEHGGFLE